MSVTVKFMPCGKEVCIFDDATIMDAEREAGLGFEYPCGGTGTCDKCLVDIDVNGERSRVKACTTKVKDGMVITIPEESLVHEDKVLTTGVNTDVVINPMVYVDEDTPALLGVAFDIGTTTIAAYLMDLRNGSQIDVLGELNEQTKYGADVVSRCIFALKNGVEEISGCVNAQADKMIGKLLEKNGFTAEDVYAVTIVGNTCMHHIFAGINPTTLVEIPYMPTVYEAFEKPARELLTNVNKDAKIFFLPVIAGFVGADTVGAMLATGFDKKEKITLLLDIGTNGEMVLGNKDRFVACSTASGPAFEGAKILFGMRGTSGAIDHVSLVDGELLVSIIDTNEAVGICGSGLIDVVSVLLDEGIIMPSGRFDRKYDGPLKDRIIDRDGSKCFLLADKVCVTQKDIREVQLAKGAIAAGIEILTETLGITYDDINEVLIAGAFGNYMRKESMCRIKLIPQELLDRIVPVGNAAGEGSKNCLVSKDEYAHASEIAKKAEFIELASHPNFQQLFIKQLDF
ncbi:MAG: DUF4445 domain-containing protein [Clostridia bacterium]|nr:DUF4445 domain-containing protein [Clostridia bacterium]